MWGALCNMLRYLQQLSTLFFNQNSEEYDGLRDWTVIMGFHTPGVFEICVKATDGDEEREILGLAFYLHSLAA